MPCYHPNVMTYSYKSGNKVYKFYGALANIGDERLKSIGPYITIPCQQCVGCRLEYSRQWATRCVLEASQYEHNYFLTLTYNEESLKEYCVRDNLNVDKETGEVLGVFESISLVPEHLTKFMKDLREYFRRYYNHVGIRFFACGEYGSKYSRPHFHIILFNCPIPDLEKLFNFRGNTYFESDIINNIWSKGFVNIGSVSFESCAYVARYVMKKQKGLNKSIYTDNGLYPEFSRMSRKPGIARSYYDKEKNSIYECDEIIIKGKNGKAVKMKPLHYYNKIFNFENPEFYEKIKAHRKECALNSQRLVKKNTDLSYSDYLSVKENYKIDSLNRLVRSLENAE